MTLPRLRKLSEQEGVLDVRRLQESCGEDAELMQEVIEEFLRIAPLSLSRLRVAVGSGDGAQLRYEAHALKGGCLTLGANALGACCQELERRGQQGEMAETAALLASAERAFVRLCTVLEDPVPKRAT